MVSLTSRAQKRNTGEFNSEISEDDLRESEKTFVDILSKYSLLYEVPFIYLVPEDGLLPEESIRFFELDPYWIQSLLDGACSIGRNTEYDYSHDEVLIQTAYRCAMGNNAQVRPQLVPERNGAEKRPDTGNIYSGFLLRSNIVSDYNGLDIVGEGEPDGDLEAAGEDKKLMLVRLEQLSSTVMLGIFSGRLHTVRIAQPRESLHLGISKIGADPASDCQVTLRSFADGKLLNQKINFRLGENHRLPIRQIAAEIHAKMSEEISSAGIALQLIQNAYTAVYTKAQKGGSSGDSNGSGI